MKDTFLYLREFLNSSLEGSHTTVAFKCCKQTRSKFLEVITIFLFCYMSPQFSIFTVSASAFFHIRQLFHPTMFFTVAIIDSNFSSHFSFLFLFSSYSHFSFFAYFPLHFFTSLYISWFSSDKSWFWKLAPKNVEAGYFFVCNFCIGNIFLIIFF